MGLVSCLMLVYGAVGCQGGLKQTERSTDIVEPSLTVGLLPSDLWPEAR